MIEVRELTKTYGTAVAVDHLTFTVPPGLVTGFLGPNGAGKSTTIRILLGLASAGRGEARINGRPYRSLRHPLREVGALTDAATVHPGRSGLDHLRWVARTDRIPRQRIEEVLALVGLTDDAGRRPATYSLGMRQRLGLAVALLGDPAVVILDEPVNGLDPHGVRWLRGLVKDLAGDGRTVLVSSHLMAEMQLTADHLVIISRGRLIADAPLRSLIGPAPQPGDLERAYLQLTDTLAAAPADAPADGTTDGAAR